MNAIVEATRAVIEREGYRIGWFNGQLPGTYPDDKTLWGFCHGCADFKARMVWLNEEILEDDALYAFVVLHEAAHVCAYPSYVTTRYAILRATPHLLSACAQLAEIAATQVALAVLDQWQVTPPPMAWSTLAMHLPVSPQTIKMWLGVEERNGEYQTTLDKFVTSLDATLRWVLEQYRTVAQAALMREEGGVLIA